MAGVFFGKGVVDASALFLFFCLIEMLLRKLMPNRLKMQTENHFFLADLVDVVCSKLMDHSVGHRCLSHVCAIC